MKSKIILFLSMLMLAGALQAAESFYVVKQVDMIGGVGYEIMTPEEYKTAYKEVQEEMRIFRTVVAECKKEWKLDKERKGSFVTSKIKVRKISKSGSTYTSREKAEIKLERMENVSRKKHQDALNKIVKKCSKMDARARAREEVKLNAFRESLEVVSKKMGDKLGRPVPNFGFDFVIPNPDIRR